MPILVNKPQLIRAGVKYPNPGYSRVVSCIAYIKSPSHRACGFTGQLGKQVRLKKVSVRFYPHIWSSTETVSFYVRHGSGVPTSPDDILRWENILPVWLWGNPLATWTAGQVFEPFEWEMDRLFEGEAHRFGIWVDVGGVVPILSTYASFQISEG